MILKPTPKQEAYITSPCKESLFGGARGGGKTFGTILDWLIHNEAYGKNTRGIVFRRELTELEDFIEEGKDILEEAGHVWMEQKKQFKSPNGALLRCRYLDDDRDALKYQGHQYTRVYIEEVGNFPNEAPVRKLLATLRSKYGIPCQLKATANPGGPGHSWVKMRWIDPAPPNTPFSVDGGKTYRVFIPSLLQDNPALMENDAEYIEMLKQVGSDELVKAWLEGNWDVVVGQYFKEFDRKRHVIPTVPLPGNWMVRYRACDWGSSRPFCVLWLAVANGDRLPGVDVDIPRGALVVYRELYGWNGQPNIGCKKTSGEVAHMVEISEMEDKRIIEDNAGLNKIDPSTFATNGGPSIAEDMARAGIWWNRADNRRVVGQGALGGWNQVRSRLRGTDGRPMIYFMDCCHHLIRTLPTLPSDPNLPDDVDTNAEDHAADALRYGCMARPYEPPEAKIIRPASQFVRPLTSFTMDDAWKCGVDSSYRGIPRD